MAWANSFCGRTLTHSQSVTRRLTARMANDNDGRLGGGGVRLHRTPACLIQEQLFRFLGAKESCRLPKALEHVIVAVATYNVASTIADR